MPFKLPTEFLIHSRAKWLLFSLSLSLDEKEHDSGNNINNKIKIK